MVSIMCRRPVCPTNVAKLVTASTGHMVTTLIFLNDKLAFFTLTVVQIALEKLDFMGLAFTIMHCQQTLPTARTFTRVADHDVLGCGFQNTLTILLRTHFKVRIFGGQVELSQLSIFFLNIQRQLLEEIGVDIESSWTPLMRTVNFLESIHLIDHIMMETGFTEILLMLAVAHIELIIFIFGFVDLCLTNLALLHLLTTVQHVFQTASQHVSHLRLFHFLLFVFGFV